MDEYIKFYLDKNKDEIKRQKKIGLNIRKEYFEPITSDSIKKLLMINLNQNQ